MFANQCDAIESTMWALPIESHGLSALHSTTHAIMPALLHVK
jgi:hypothetical protein